MQTVTRSDPTSRRATPPSAHRLDVPAHTLRRGSKGPNVRRLQKALVGMGHMTQAQMDSGPGEFGQRTKNALKRFQAAHKLKADGVYGGSTHAALAKAAGYLDAPAKQLRLGAKGVPVTKLQRSLVRTGHMSQADKAASAGKFDKQTEQALERFQRARGLKADGAYGPRTRAALERAVEATPNGSPGWFRDTYERAGKHRGLLSKGDRGKAVRALEKKIEKLGYEAGKQDGKFDLRTKRAVANFQRDAGLRRTGRVDVATARRLEAGKKDKAQGGRPFTGYVNGQPRNFRVSSIGDGQVLRTDAANSYNRMKAAAARDGVHLSAASGARSMAQQQELYRRYLNGTGNLAARPGYSNHQGGISVDVGGLGGYGTRGYRWLANNARRYGFVNDVRGEFWHWTYRR